MSAIEWKKVKKFKAGEFPEDPNMYAEPDLIYTLQDVRVDHGKKIYPSPVTGALARFGGSPSSQHYVGYKDNIVRKSTAIDVFPEGVPFWFYSHLLRHKQINGIGIYLDTNGPDGSPWVMFHFDIRPVGFKNMPLVWISKKIEGKQKYFYPHKDTELWKLLNDVKFFTYRTKNK